MDPFRLLHDRSLSRRDFLRMAGAGAAGLALSSGALRRLTSVATANTYGPDSIEHVVIFMQENRSFDHYFWDRAGVNGLPPGFSLEGHPWYAFGRECLGDVPHDWDAMHANDAAWRDSRYTGARTLAYAPKEQIPLYRSLADHYTLCDDFYCSVLGPTHPNRLYSVAGTSLGQKDNDANEMVHDTILDRLEDGGVPWKVYNLNADAGVTPGPEQLNVFVYFPQHRTDPRVVLPFETYLADIEAGTLPAVSFVMSEILFSEHPAAPLEWGQYATWQVLRPLMRSAYWPKSLFVLYYDESGGFFDHAPPPAAPDDDPEFRSFGPRVPALLVSPFAAGGRVAQQQLDHTSVLRYLEDRFALPGGPLSERDATTASVGDALDYESPVFDLPPVADVTLTARTLAECAGDAPQWGPQQAGRAGYPSLWEATGLDPQAIPI
jgi:phospholipase C